jgi:mycothiol synthase
MSWPNYRADTDCFLAWAGDELVGWADLFLRKRRTGPDGEPLGTENLIYTEAVVHPAWRRQGIGGRLLKLQIDRARERLVEVPGGPVYLSAQAGDAQAGCFALFEAFGLARVRYYFTMARPLNGDLPPNGLPPGYRLRTFDPGRDLETVWEVDNLAFRDHWGFSGFPLNEFRHWIETAHFRPELWLLAEEKATGKVVGIGLNEIDPGWIAKTGRQEGHVQALGVLREHRKRGLGSGLLARGLDVLRGSGMEWAMLGADAANQTGAVRLYERLGFGVRKTRVAYRLALREG